YPRLLERMARSLLTQIKILLLYKMEQRLVVLLLPEKAHILKQTAPEIKPILQEIRLTQLEIRQTALMQKPI
ncbi:MAG: hypothetical protein EBT34_02680, partial [Acetobacteraceae bacterium]|nr:hypothetical protein [Acetobacteraceae bacterium]